MAGHIKTVFKECNVWRFSTNGTVHYFVIETHLTEGLILRGLSLTFELPAPLPWPLVKGRIKQIPIGHFQVLKTFLVIMTLICIFISMASHLASWPSPFFGYTPNAFPDIGSVGRVEKKKLKKITRSFGIGGPGTPGRH